MRNIHSPTGKLRWSREATSKLLSNEKYTGCVLLKKTLSVCGTQFKNEGELQQVLIRNHHEAIILAEDFVKVQLIKNEHTVNFQKGCLAEKLAGHLFRESSHSFFPCEKGAV